MQRKTLIEVNNRSAYDRFIPRRDDPEFASHLIESYNSNSNNSDFDVNISDIGVINSAKHLYYKKNYSSLLRKTLLPNKNKILQFSSPRKSHMKKSNVEEIGWPVYARLKPLLTAPSIILDMPDLSSHLNHQVVDWGKTGYMATTFDGEVHLWHPTKMKRFVTETYGKVKDCVKWNCAGTVYAMSMVQSGIGIWDFKREKIITQGKCFCKYGCIITAMVWTKANNLITGCSKGVICLWLSEMKIDGKSFRFIEGHTGDIINIKLSPGERYLVTAGVDRTVKTWCFPSLKGNYEIKFDIPIKAVAFHPWRDSLLAVGTPDYLGIWNVNTRQKIDSRKHSSSVTIEYIDNLTFNPLSGELVVSCLCSDNSQSYSTLRVLKNLDCVVDEIQFKFGRIPYILWDGTGTQLATAASDESLCIWDFFGKSTEWLEKERNKKKKLTTNMFETLKMFGTTIR